MGKKRALLREIAASSSPQNKKAKFLKSGSKKLSKSSNSSDNKNKRETNSDSDSDSDSDESDAGIALNSKGSKDIEEFTFEFYDMKESFVESITTLLKGLFINPTTSYEIACKIVAQDAVGTAVVCEGGEDVFAFGTILSRSSQVGSPLVKFLDGLLQAVESSLGSKEPVVTREFRECISGPRASKTGILLHRRYPNFPPQLIHPLYSNLYEDIQWIKQQSLPSDSDSSTNELHGLSHVIVLSTCSFVDGVTLAEKQSSLLDRTALYDEFEDELFVQHASAGVAYRPSGSTPVCAAVLSLSSFKGFLKDLQAMCPSDN